MEKVKLYSDVCMENIKWLWEPYIPYGKITLIQGDPGCGKSTFVLHILGCITRGMHPYKLTENGEPKRVMYQCSEDGLADTIKPRLIMAGADCKMVGFIEEDDSTPLTIDDERIEKALEDFRPKALVIDPIQAYIGNDSDLMVAGKARKMMRRLSMWASKYGCAVILVGHMNKKEGSKDLYRSLGSIDLVAAARSVIHIEAEDEDVRTVRQIKNSLGQRGPILEYVIDPDGGFKWGRMEISNEYSIPTQEEQSDVNNLILHQLSDGDKSAKEMMALLTGEGLSERSIRRLKSDLRIQSIRKNSQWYWSLGGSLDA